MAMDYNHPISYFGRDQLYEYCVAEKPMYACLVFTLQVNVQLVTEEA